MSVYVTTNRILLWIFIFTTPVKCMLLDLLSSEDIQRYFDVPTIDRVPEYDIVSPYTEDESGRRRRDINTQDEIKEIKLQAFGEHFHMRLKENRYLLADGLDIEQLHANGTVERIPLERRMCFYIGQLITHNVSTVAVSTCKGMMGIIAMEKEHLFIRPLRADHAAEYRRRRRDVENLENVDNPHIIYRRSITEDSHEQNVLKATNNTHFCGLDQDYYENAAFFNDAVKLSKHKEKLVEKTKYKKIEHHSVKKRAVGCDVKFIEIRLMVDRDMVNYHQQDVMDYTLTLMNTVAARYAESTLGTLVHLHIVKFETIMTDSYSDGSGNTLQISADGQSTLESLATFQRQSYIHDDNDPNHWDVAMLVTRKNLQYQGSDALQGIAFEDGTCDPVYGAGVSQDSGLSSGQIIAHEIGHTLGMNHDGGGTNTFCQDQVNVMSSSRPIGAGAYKWSSCSQQNFDSYLSDVASSSCLNDIPNSVTTHPVNSGTYPGYQLITADEQCQLLSDTYSGVCAQNNMEEICERLTCRSFDNRCYYQTVAAEGTACGNGRWCVSGACVASAGNFPTRVDGGWSYWTSYSQCSRTCGGGVRTRTRCCDSPKPQHGGTACRGDSSEVELCNTQSCTTSQPDFAHEQCAATANEPWRDGFYTWEAYFEEQTEQELCEFKCLNNANWVVPRGSAFQDGTRCSVDRRNELKKCVQGNCVEFGCDNKLGSNQRFDNCRVCGGSGTSCTPNNGFYTDGTPYELTAFLDIPADSTSIEISNTTPLTSFMALKTTNGQYLFGNSNQPVSGEYYHNGIIVKYFYAIDSEDIIIDGPTPVAYVAEVYRVSRSNRPTITYSYYTSSGAPPPPPPTQAPAPTYFWQTTEGPCSVTCGSGTQQVSVQCFSPSTGTIVSDAFCNPGARPATTQQQCTLAACPTPAGPTNYWMISFGQCSVTCGTGTKTQTAICYSPSLGMTVADSECNPSTRPSTSAQECFEQICNYWIESEGGCSVTCGFGTSTRFWRCFSPASNTIVSDNQCDFAARPADTQQSCFPQQCNPIWLTFPYGDCDATCGVSSYQTRTVQCVIPNGQSHTQVDDSQCASQSKPETTIPCNQDLPACGVWHIGSWSQCSVTCERGFQFRTVVCRPEGWEAFLPNPPTLNDAECRESKPSTLQQCDTGITCQTSDYYWAQGGLGDCSVTCGTGVATRQLLCIESIRGSTRTVPDSFCQGLASPPTQDECVQPACQGVWQEMRWRQCSTTCGPGSQSRQVVCRPEGYESLINPPILPDTQCNADNKPMSQRSCNVGTCPSLTTPSTGTDYLWLPFNWDPCSATCGHATRTRRVWCVVNRDSNYVLADDESFCDGLFKPETTEVCTQLPACEGVTNPPSNSPDQGSPCAGLYTRSFNNLDHITQSSNGRYCNETIVAPLGQKIKITFHKCNIQCDKGDESSIRDGHRNFQLCCIDDTFEWTSKSNVVQLEHQTSDNGHGYNISVQFVTNSETTTTDCDKLLTEPTGSISSPLFPASYSADQKCETTIVAPPGKKVKLTFQSFDLLADEPWAPEHCYFPSDDNVEVYDLESNTGTRFCGKYNNLDDLQTTPLQNRVLVKFQSNADGRASNGFSLNYKVED